MTVMFFEAAAWVWYPFWFVKPVKLTAGGNNLVLQITAFTKLQSEPYTKEKEFIYNQTTEVDGEQSSVWLHHEERSNYPK